MHLLICRLAHWCSSYRKLRKQSTCADRTSVLCSVSLMFPEHFVLTVVFLFECWFILSAAALLVTRNMCEGDRPTAFLEKKIKNYKARSPRLTAVSSLQGQVSMLVCNLLNWLSQPFATECTNNAFRAEDGLGGTTGRVDVSDINGNH